MRNSNEQRATSNEGHIQILPITAEEIASCVSEQELKRLLEWPRSRELGEELQKRAIEAREWYARNGHPFAAASRIAVKMIRQDAIQLNDDTELRSVELAERLIEGESQEIVSLVVSAGPEVASEIAKHWSEGRPDEAFFLDRFAVAVAEQLVGWCSTFLCRESEQSNETLLPHLSPGCGDWDLQDQHQIMSLLSPTKSIGPIQLLSSGALNPQHSLLAVLGVTRRKYDASPEDMCRRCDLNPCSFRRTPTAKAQRSLG